MIKLVDVSKYYKTESTVVMGLHKVNLEFNVGEFVAITGESGSGKSTLLNVISGVDSYEDGELYIDNEETSYYSQADFEKFRKEHVAFIFQSYNLIENYSVLQNVEAALIIKNVEKKERIKRAKNIIDRVGLTSRIRAKTSKLSGGEKQRLAIARALAQNTKFIVADEPTGNLDSKSGEAILKLLHDLSKDKLIIIVTHNYEQVEPYITRKIRLFDGEVVEDKIIKQIEVVEENIIKNQNGVKNNIFKIPLKFALMNLLSQPKKTILILLVTIMTTFFLFIFYGGYATIKAVMTDFSSYSAYNGFDERIIITKGKDDQGNNISLTESDYDFLKSLKYVDDVIKYEEGLDTPLNFNNIDYEYDLKITSLYNQEPYMYPVSLISETDLLGGRLPENPNEIVISYLESYNKTKNNEIAEHLNASSIKLDANLKHINNVSGEVFKIKNFEIVGITKENTEVFGVFVVDDTLKDISNLYNVSEPKIVVKYNIEGESGEVILDRSYVGIGIDYSLKENELLIGTEMEDFISNLEDENNAQNIKLFYEDKEIQIVIENLDDYYSFYVNSNLLIEDSFPIYQYSLIVKDTTKLKSVINSLSNNQYEGLSYLLASENVDDNLSGDLLVISIAFGFYAIFLIVIIYLFSYLSIRSVLLSSKKNYNIFRVLGISPKQIQIMSGIEVIISFLYAYLFNLVVFILIKNLNIKYVSEYISYIKFTDYLLLLIVNIGLSILVANRYSKLLSKRSLMATVKVGG